MTLQEFTIEYALRHKEMPQHDLIESILPFLEDYQEDKSRLHIYQGCYLKVLNELRISPSFILPAGFVICVTDVFYSKDKTEVAFNYRFDIVGRDSQQHVNHHHFKPHPVDIIGSVFEIVQTDKCSVLIAKVDSKSATGKRKYSYSPDNSTLL